MQFVSFAVLGKRIKSIKALLKDPNVPKRKKFLIIFGIIYLLMPIDLIPAPVLIFGFVDDIVLWLFILTHLKDELDSYWKENGDDIPLKKDLLNVCQRPYSLLSDITFSPSFSLL